MCTISLPLWIPAFAGMTGGVRASPAFASLRVPVVGLIGLREGDGGVIRRRGSGYVLLRV